MTPTTPTLLGGGSLIECIFFCVNYRDSPADTQAQHIATGTGDY